MYANLCILNAYTRRIKRLCVHMSENHLIFRTDMPSRRFMRQSQFRVRARGNRNNAPITLHPLFEFRTGTVEGCRQSLALRFGVHVAYRSCFEVVRQTKTLIVKYNAYYRVYK